MVENVMPVFKMGSQNDCELHTKKSDICIKQFNRLYYKE